MPDALNLHEALQRVSQMDDAQWRTTVFVALEKIDGKLDQLNGTTEDLKKKVRWHDRALWMLAGIVAFVTFVSQVVKALQ